MLFKINGCLNPYGMVYTTKSLRLSEAFVFSLYRSSGGCFADGFVAEHHHTVEHIYQYGLCFIDITGQDAFAQLVDDFFLNEALQWTGTELRIIPVFGQVIDRIFTESKVDVAF